MTMRNCCQNNRGILRELAVESFKEQLDMHLDNQQMSERRHAELTLIIKQVSVGTVEAYSQDVIIEPVCNVDVEKTGQDSYNIDMLAYYI